MKVSQLLSEDADLPGIFTHKYAKPRKNTLVSRIQS